MQHKENVIIGLDKESLGRFPLFSALQEKNKKQQHKPKFCPVKPRGASDWFLWFELVGRQRWSHYNRTDWFFFYKLNLYPRCTLTYKCFRCFCGPRLPLHFQSKVVQTGRGGGDGDGGVVMLVQSKGLKSLSRFSDSSSSEKKSSSSMSSSS